jgi:hypothetical protein
VSLRTKTHKFAIDKVPKRHPDVRVRMTFVYSRTNLAFSNADKFWTAVPSVQWYFYYGVSKRDLIRQPMTATIFLLPKFSACQVEKNYKPSWVDASCNLPQNRIVLKCLSFSSVPGSEFISEQENRAKNPMKFQGFVVALPCKLYHTREYTPRPREQHRAA